MRITTKRITVFIAKMRTMRLRTKSTPRAPTSTTRMSKHTGRTHLPRNRPRNASRNPTLLRRKIFRINTTPRKSTLHARTGAASATTAEVKASAGVAIKAAIEVVIGVAADLAGGAAGIAAAGRREVLDRRDETFRLRSTPLPK